MESAAKPKESRDLLVVSDRQGFVGAFLTLEAASTVVLRTYPTLRFIVQRFPLEDGPQDHVWLVLYQGNDLVAFASNSREKAVQMQTVYSLIGAVYDEDLDYWKQPLGVIPPTVVTRLDSEHRAHVMYAGPLAEEAYRKLEEADAERIERFMAESTNGPLERAIRENERISIIGYIVAEPLESHDESERAAETPPAVLEDSTQGGAS